MVTTILGKNSYAVQHKVSGLVKDFQEKNGSSIERFDMSDGASVDDVVDAVRSISFLEPQKMVVVRNFGTSSALLDRVEQLLDSVADSTHLLLVDSSLDRRSSAFKSLRSGTQFLEFSEPNEIELQRWVQEIGKQYGVIMDSASTRYLVDRVGLKQQLLAQEIQKLANTGQPVNKQLIDSLIEATPQSVIFALLDSLFKGDLERTLSLYEDQRLQGEEPHKILSMIVWQLEKLTLAVFAPDRSPETLIAAGLSPYNARKTIELSSRLSKTQLQRYVQALVECDSVSKKNADIESALTVYFAEVAKG